MSLKQRIDEEIKTAMKAKDKDRLEALRGIKSQILLAETAEGASADGLAPDKEAQILMKMAKQRRDSAQIFGEQGRADLQAVELAQLAVVEEFLPKMMGGEELREKIKAIIAQVGATSAKEMGKVMGAASKELAGKADNKDISALVKELLA